MNSNPKVSIGIIGAGNIATAIATRAAATGRHDVLLSNSRGPETLAELVARLAGVRAGTVEQASQAQIVVLSVPWSAIPKAVGAVSDWTGKTLIDTTNPIEPPTFRAAELNGKTSSEVVAALTPGAKLVKAFNTHNPGALASDPSVAGGTRVMFYSGDDPEAKQSVQEFISGLGFKAVDLGGLATGGAMQQFPGGPLAGRDLVQL
ncbi:MULTISPECIES: NADPH-dependent F420 reductase [unclassified Curtobacterium]|uniref:NADPH-dependent F420 reductase n=1 Tax=unclassified Curtobacterium TaxID=257496 RepID=UPI000D91BC71|nr:MULTISPECIES: NAD(P)-binding domain-containing protein [unclassified Curtobacterium]PYY32500.1 NADP oxidoreductase [Curtobacterium sp. MCBD17_030]PZE86877.1 NADP oxidoreductase [Curtobacterium sp. MCBD17_032]